MSAQRPPDPQLNSALSWLMGRLAGALDASVSLGADDVPGVNLALLEYLVGCGLVDLDQPAKSVICEGCEQACPMPITFRQEPACCTNQCFVVCDKRTDIGLVLVDPVRLRRWRLSIERLAGALVALLKTDGTPTRIPGRQSWNLGELAVGSRRIPVTLLATVKEAALSFGLGIMLDGLNGSTTMPGLSADQLLVFREGLLGIRQDVLQQALAGRLGDTRVACEIRFERGDVILLNHVTGRRRVLAHPNFDSTNENVFQHLYDRPGQVFTLDQLRKAVRIGELKDLHKSVEVLRFEGVLKQLFFRVSKNVIQFDRTVTFGQLAILDVDPGTVA